MGYKKQRTSDGKPGVNFDGFILECEMISATGLKKSQIHGILRTSDGDFLTFVTRSSGWWAYVFFSALLCLFMLRYSRIAAISLAATTFVISAIRARENYRNYRAVRQKYRNLIGILGKIQTYNNISDKLQTAHELQKHGVQLNIHSTHDDLEAKLVQLRANIIKALNTDRILRNYSSKWGEMEVANHQVSELTDLDSICAVQVEELQIALNTDARLLREAEAEAGTAASASTPLSAASSSTRGTSKARAEQ